MKKKFLVLCAFALVFTTATFAQGFHVGFKGGANILQVDGKSFKDEFRFGYNLGGFAEINFNNKLGVQPEVIWSQTNFRTSADIKEIVPGSVSDVKGKLNYLSIPILLNYRPVKLITLQAGPQFGILINQDRNLMQNGQEAFKHGDFSMVGGAQLNFGGFKAGGRYLVGLNNINDLGNQDKWKNQGFQLYIGFRIL